MQYFFDSAYIQQYANSITSALQCYSKWNSEGICLASGNGWAN